MSRRALADPTLVERYIRGGVMPRFMQRLREIDDELHGHRMRLGTLYAELRDTLDAEAFAERWLHVAHSWRFDHVNALIDQHNSYYPIERRLPLNPRTGDYVTVGGRPWQREPVGVEWVLERFPARLPRAVRTTIT